MNDKDENKNLSSTKRDRWSKFADSTSENIKYAESRFDILIISLSSGGIVLDLNVVSKLLDNDICTCYLILVKISLICYLFAILGNLFSQIASSKANRLIKRFAEKKIRFYDGEINGVDQKLKDSSKRYDFYNDWLNEISLLFLLLGMLFFVIFAFKHF